MPKEESAGAIIYILKNNVPHYLLLHYPSGHWEFARGHKEEGESEEITVRREVEEETGLRDIKIIPGFKEHTKLIFRRTYNLKPSEKKRAPWIVKIVTLYLAQAITQDVKISEEHQGFLWLPYEEAHKKLLKKGRDVLEKAHQFLLNKLYNDSISPKGV